MSVTAHNRWEPKKKKKKEEELGCQSALSHAFSEVSMSLSSWFQLRLAVAKPILLIPLLCVPETLEYHM